MKKGSLWARRKLETFHERQSMKQRQPEIKRGKKIKGSAVAGLCLCVWCEHLYRCAARCDRRGPKGLRRAWSLAGFVPKSSRSDWLSASSLSLSRLSPSPGAADDTHPSFSFSSSSEKRIIARYTDTHTHSTIVKPDPVLRAPAVKPVSRVLQYNKNIGKKQNKTCINKSAVRVEQELKRIRLNLANAYQ